MVDPVQEEKEGKGDKVRGGRGAKARRPGTSASRRSSTPLLLGRGRGRGGGREGDAAEEGGGAADGPIMMILSPVFGALRARASFSPPSLRVPVDSREGMGSDEWVWEQERGVGQKVSKLPLGLFPQGGEVGGATATQSVWLALSESGSGP